MSKPTQAYLELMQKFKANEDAEKRAVAEAALKKANEDRILKESHEMNTMYDRQRNRDNAIKAYNEFTTKVKEGILENILMHIVQKSMPTVLNEDANFTRAVVNDFIQNESVYSILNEMRGKTEFLNELADEIDDTYEKETVAAKPDDPDSLVVGDKGAEETLISKLDSSEDLEDATDIIRNKVSRATDEFIERNVMNQTEIKNTLMDAKRRMEEVRSGDNAVDEEIRQEHATMAKKKVAAIRNRANSVFEQLVTNIAGATVKDENLKQYYTNESGSLDMEKIVSRATQLYTVMETLNTLKFKDFQPDDVKRFIEFE